MTLYDRNRRATSLCRRGLTLTELVVVITVIVIITAVMVPLARPLAKGRDIREAARQINVFLAGAQARAIEKGRPVGVWLVRDEAGGTKSSQLHIAEVPPPYAGDGFDSRVSINGFVATFIVDDGATAIPGSGADAVAPPFVNVGDSIKFDFKGPQYRITQITPRTNVSFANPINPLYLPPGAKIEPYPIVPFQIFRRPRKTAAAPLVLPNNVSVELNASGYGINGLEFADSLGSELVIMFNPDGTVENIYPNGVNPVDTDVSELDKQRPSGTINLLLGRSDQNFLTNLQDTNSLWVTIGHRSGTIATAPNASIPPAATDLPTQVAAARQLTRTAQGMGGL